MVGRGLWGVACGGVACGRGLLTALYSISSICRRAISARSALICWLVLSWFTTTLFLMLRARLAYLSVFSVSMKSRSEGLTQAIMMVWLGSAGVWNEGRGHRPARGAGASLRSRSCSRQGALRTWAEPGAGAPHHLARVSTAAVVTAAML